MRKAARRAGPGSDSTAAVRASERNLLTYVADGHVNAHLMPDGGTRMSITNSQAAPLGLLLMYAMDMFTDMGEKPTTLTPAVDSRVTDAGWTVRGYLTASDAVFGKGAPLGRGERVYYGFVAQDDSGRFVAVVRGTHGLAEWIEDAKFVPIPHPTIAGATVEQGFWDIYAGMELVATDGSAIGSSAASGIPQLVGAGPLLVLGHSLGSALATYLSLDLAKGALGGRVSACLFASPQTGDTAFAREYDATLADYRVFNYVLDVVPRVPLGLGYATLPRTTVLQPATSEAVIRVDVSCNHHVICYSAMLDFEATQAPGVVRTDDDKQCAACILGPETASPTMAKLLAGIAGGMS